MTSDTEIQEAWLFFSKDDDGNVPIEDLGGLMRALGRVPTQAEVEQLKKEMDPNGSGWVEWERFWGLATSPIDPAQVKKEQQELREAFKVFDKDGNGMISGQELRHLMTTMAEELSEAEADEMLKYLDVDGDGQINYQEFTAMILQNQTVG